jgi:hypothetical protein
VQLGAEVAQVQRRVQRAVAPVRQQHRHRVADEGLGAQLPVADLDVQFKQTLAGAQVSAFGHD